MKICDNGKVAGTTLDDVSTGDVVRLKNGKLYLVSETYDRELYSSLLKRKRLLTNLETGCSHMITDGHRISATVVHATLEVT